MLQFQELNYQEPLEVIIYEFNMKIKCVNTASMK